MSAIRFASVAALAIGLSACVAGPRVDPVEVTRFHSAAALPSLGKGTIFVETAPGLDTAPDEVAPYKAAIAAELAKLGYRESARSEAGQIAQVRVARSLAQPAESRSPVSVGVGGSTGSYGSGVGLGLGINLGGGQREMQATDIGVMIRDTASGAVIWEGRARLTVSDNAGLAETRTNAAAISEALFREFPGNNGETVEVKVAQ